VRGLKEPDETDVGKKDWALFLASNVQLSTSKILEIYALRCGIEVYFKEAKQHLGFLKEQTATFALHAASVHLCAIRYLILVHNKLVGHENRIGDIRADIQEQLHTLNFAGRLWKIFRSITSGAIHDLSEILGRSKEALMEIIDERVNTFFVSSLQLDAITLRLEYE